MDGLAQIRIRRRYATDRGLSGAQVSPEAAFLPLRRLIGTVLRFDVPYDCSVELSTLGYQFFTDIFQIFDKVCHLFSMISTRLTFIASRRIKTEPSVPRSSKICSKPRREIRGLVKAFPIPQLQTRLEPSRSKAGWHSGGGDLPLN
jgi:hypothetical protein